MNIHRPGMFVFYDVYETFSESEAFLSSHKEYNKVVAALKGVTLNLNLSMYTWITCDKITMDIK